MSKKNIFILLAFLLSLSLSACASVEEHIWLKSLGWSRALFVGNTAYKDPVPVAINAQGEQAILLIEKEAEGDSAHFRLKVYAKNADLLWDNLLSEIDVSKPENATLLWDAETLRLFWIDEEQLYTLSVDSSGNMVGDPLLLSEGETVGSLSAVTDSTNGIRLFYAGTREEPGVYALNSFDGTQPKSTLDPVGFRIQARYDQQGILHLGWVRYPAGYGTSEIVYATDSGEPLSVQEITTSPVNVLDGPVLGVDADGIYLFWTVTIRTGMEAGTVQTQYLYFPYGQPAPGTKPQQFFAPALSSSLTQVAFAPQSLRVGERVDLRSERLPLTADVVELATNLSPSGELALAFQSPTQHLWRKMKKQVNLIYFAGGEPTSYQPLSYTTTLSTTPNIVSDADGYLYITWLEKQQSDWHTVYFASTAPEMVTALGHTTGDEFLRVFGQVVFGLLVGMLMAPIAGAVWMLAPMFVLLLTSPLRKLSNERTRMVMTVLSVVLAIVAYWVGKFAVLPGMSAYVPFSAWVPEISVAVGNLLRWFVPLFFSLVALLIAWHYTFRQSNDSTLYFLLIYIGVDALLTSAVYAVLIFGGI